VTRRTVAISAVASALLAVSACSTTVTGTPSPEPRATSSSPSAGEALNALDACTVLDHLLAGQGFDPGVSKTARNECHASKLEYGTLSLALDPSQGLAEFEASADAVTQFDLSGRRAVSGVPAGPGTCAVVLEVTEHARAMAGATMLAPERQAQACPAARELATALEPLLPR